MVLESGKSALRSSLFQDIDYFQQSQALEATYGVTYAGDLNTGDGIATPWSFNRSDFDIYSISFKGERKDAEFGLAFDKFSFVPVPIPSTLILFIIGIAALIGFHRQRLNL